VLLIIHDFMRRSKNTAVLLNKQFLSFLNRVKMSAFRVGLSVYRVVLATILICHPMRRDSNITTGRLVTTREKAIEICLRYSKRTKRSKQNSRPPNQHPYRDLGYEAAVGIRLEFRLMSSLC
jgi:hypothetical protein